MSATAPAGPAAAVPAAAIGPARRALAASWQLRVGGAILLAMALGALALILVGGDPHRQDLAAVMQPPSGAYWLGTDQVGRDMLLRVAYGIWASFLVAAGAVFIGGGIGVVLGMVAAHFRGALDAAIGLVADTLLAAPALVLALALSAALGPGLFNVGVAIGVVYLPQFLRLARGQALGIEAQSFMESARAAGAGHLYLLAVYVLPNIAPPLIAFAFVSLCSAVLTEAALSYLGVGVQPPAASLGYMVRTGSDYIVLKPALAIIPGVVIFLIAIALNLIGDGLQRAFQQRVD